MRRVDVERPPLRVGLLRDRLVAPAGPYARLDVVADTGSTNQDLRLAGTAADRVPDRTVLVAEPAGPPSANPRLPEAAMTMIGEAHATLRRAGAALAGAAFALLLAASIHGPLWLFLLFAFGFGAMALCLYALAVAHMNDLLEPHEVLSATQGLLLASGGGAALSVRYITGKPIKFVGTGEKSDGLDVFHPDRAASRILDMGDVLSMLMAATDASGEERMTDQQLRDEVMTPGGTTAAAFVAMEKAGFVAAVYDGVGAATERARGVG